MQSSRTKLRIGSQAPQPLSTAVATNCDICRRIGLPEFGASILAGTPALLIVWIPAALVAMAISAVANAAKARRLGIPLWNVSVRKMAWGIAPALAAGALLTQALTAAGATHLLPGTWLALYGTGVTASGTFSVQAVRWMGLTVLALGGLALLQADLGLVLLASGFGGAHLAFGFYIAHKHGG